MSAHYVYLYREPGSGKAKYVGYGHGPARAMSHADASHNAALREWLESGSYSLDIAGPYRDHTEGLAVEAALISVLAPAFNVDPGTGPKFHPLGVPPELADRLVEPPLSETELGVQASGALLVYLGAGDVTADGRMKPDPTTPDVETIAVNAEGWWALSHHVPGWVADPSTSPQTLVAVYGTNPAHRFVIGSFQIAGDKWSTVMANAKNLWPVPLADRTLADAAQLRGRRVGVRFGRGRHDHYYWVDSGGARRAHRP